MELSSTVPPNSFPIQPALKIKMLYSPPCVSLPVIILSWMCNEKRGVVLPTVIAVWPSVLTVHASVWVFVCVMERGRKINTSYCNPYFPIFASPFPWDTLSL